MSRDRIPRATEYQELSTHNANPKIRKLTDLTQEIDMTCVVFLLRRNKPSSPVNHVVVLSSTLINQICQAFGAYPLYQSRVCNWILRRSSLALLGLASRTVEVGAADAYWSLEMTVRWLCDQPQRWQR